MNERKEIIYKEEEKKEKEEKEKEMDFKMLIANDGPMQLSV